MIKVTKRNCWTPLTDEWVALIKEIAAPLPVGVPVNISSHGYIWDERFTVSQGDLQIEKLGAGIRVMECTSSQNQRNYSLVCWL